MAASTFKEFGGLAENLGWFTGLARKHGYLAQAQWLEARRDKVAADVAALRRARFWLEVLAEVADVEVETTSIAFNAIEKDGGKSRELTRVNLRDDLAALDAAIGEPFNRTAIEPVLAMARELSE